MTIPTEKIEVTADEAELIITLFDGAMGDDAGRLPIYQNLKLIGAQLSCDQASPAFTVPADSATTIDSQQFKKHAGNRYRCRSCGHECMDPEIDMEYLKKAGCVSCCSNRRMEACH